MIKFVGTPKGFEAFMSEMMENYGRLTTIKDVCRMVGAYYGNV